MSSLLKSCNIIIVRDLTLLVFKIPKQLSDWLMALQYIIKRFLMVIL